MVFPDRQNIVPPGRTGQWRRHIYLCFPRSAKRDSNALLRAGRIKYISLGPISRCPALQCLITFSTDIREKWTLNGSLPGEPVEPVELGTGAPVTGLYIREDVDMRCSILMAGFVKKTLKKSHASLIERLKIKAQMASTAETHARVASGPVPLSPSASVRSDLGQSWTQSSSVSSASPSVKAFMPQLHYRHYTPPQIPPAYQSTPSTAPSSVCSTPQKQYTSTPPLVSAFNHSMRQHQCRTERKPLPSPPQPQHHSRPPAYARYEHEPSPPPQHLPQPPKYGHLSRPEQSPLVPEPLRLRRDSACSVGSRTSSAPHNGRNTAAAVHAMPSVRYRASHPDYPQMNPYAEDDRQVADRDTSVPGVGAVAGDVRRGPAIRGEATLMGPFIAELEG